MTVVFEDGDWQIVNHGSRLVYVRHNDLCKTYAYHYMNRKKGNSKFICSNCDTKVPSHIQALVTLNNWED